MRRTTFPTDDHPVNPLEIQLEGTKERFTRDKTDPGGQVAQLVEPVGDRLVLNRRSKPDMVGYGSASEQVLIAPPKPERAGGPLRQNLVHMLPCPQHDCEHSANIRLWNLVVEEIRHRVDEYHPTIPPASGL
jgi:hypothetical protein